MQDGGGVRGKDAGIAHVTMTGDGCITEESHHFTEKFLRVGGIVTEIAIGEVISGIIREYPTKTLKENGVHGRERNIGKSIMPGE